MADKKPSISRPNSDTIIVVWSGVTEADDMLAAQGLSEHADRSVEVSGSLGGATVTIQGSNGGSAYFTLNDPLGNALSFAANGLKAILEYAEYIKPVRTGGSSASINVTLIAKRR